MKTILVIGATSGIAKAIAHQFAQEKHSLILAGRDLDDLDRIARDMNIRYGVPVRVEAFDAVDYEGHEAFFQACTREEDLFGVVLAQGYMVDQKEAQDKFAEAKRIIDVNYLSSVSILEKAAAYFEEQRAGFICVISSVAGDRGRQSNYIYGSAKGGLSVYLQGLRNRLFPAGIPVVTVKPGFVDTKMTFGLPGMFLVAKPEQVARAVVKAVRKGKNTLYTPSFWALIMLIIKLVPETVFKRLKL